jgi:hypothetical protein
LYRALATLPFAERLYRVLREIIAHQPCERANNLRHRAGLPRAGPHTASVQSGSRLPAGFNRPTPVAVRLASVRRNQVPVDGKPPQVRLTERASDWTPRRAP